MIADLYDLQAKCERIAAQARKADKLDSILQRAAKRYAALQATLTAERKAHTETKQLLRATQKMAAAMARRIQGNRS